jgi:hypothetical protein
VRVVWGREGAREITCPLRVGMCRAGIVRPSRVGARGEGARDCGSTYVGRVRLAVGWVVWVLRCRILFYTWGVV